MNNNYLYIAYINYINLEKKNTSNTNNEENDILKYSIIGYYDKKTNIWYNAWSIYDNLYYDQYKLSKKLLIYALDIEKNLSNIDSYIKIIIRYILTSSKIYITEQIQLEIILSIITYFSKAKNIIRREINNIIKYYVYI